MLPSRALRLLCSATLTIAAGSAVLVGGADSASAAATVPGAPTNLTAVAGHGSILYSWTAPASDGGSTITGYKVLVVNTAGTEDSTPDSSVDCTTTTATTCTATGLTAGETYHATVKAINAVGRSAGSNEVGATPYTVPNAPTNLTARPADGAIAYSWRAPEGDGGSTITGYKVLVVDTAGTEDSTPDSSVDCTTTATFCTVTGLTDSKPYYATVKAINAAGRGPGSNEAGAIPGHAPAVPGAPTGLRASAGKYQVSLTWTAPTSTGGAPVSYDVFQGVSSGDQNDTKLSVCSTIATSCTVGDLPPGDTFYYVVEANNGAGASAPSDEASATPIGVPGAPYVNYAQPGNASLTVFWQINYDDGGSPITSYDVFVSTTSGGEDDTGAVGCSTGGDVGYCTVTGLTNGTSYFAAVEARNAVGSSVFSDEVGATPDDADPSPVTNPRATAGDGQVTLTWDPSPSAAKDSTIAYEVYDGEDPGDLEDLGCEAGSSTSCTVSGLDDGSTYYFAVYAHDDAYSTPADEVSATPDQAIVNAPTALSATAGTGGLTLSWTAPFRTSKTPLGGYVVLAAATAHDEDAHGVRVCSTTATSCTPTGLVKGSTYSFVVRSFTAGAASTDSNEATATDPVTVPGAPTGVSAVGGARVATISWSAPADSGGRPVTGYQVLSSGTPVCATPATVCTVTGLTDGTTYSFSVVALNAVGASPASATATALTLAVPTATLKVTPTVVSGAKQTFTGTAAPGAPVTLSLAGRTIATTTATVTGTWTLTAALKKSGSYTVTSGGLTSAVITIKVLTLSLHVSGHKITGTAPAGTTVALLVGGRTVATTKATKRNAFSFTRTLHGRHTLKVKDQGVTSKSTTVRAA